MSPADRRRRVVRKLERWLAVGVQVAWLIEPNARVASIHHADGSVVSVPADGRLTAGETLPGFSCPLAAVHEL